MTTTDRNNKILDIVKHCNANNKTDEAIEHMAELTRSLLKYRTNPCNYRLNNLIEWLSEATFSMVQLAIIYDCGDDVERTIDKIINRQIERIERDESERAGIDMSQSMRD